MVLSLTKRAGVAIATLDNPPVNALSAAVRQALCDAVAEIDADPSVHGAVLVCAGRTFVAGADVREFGLPPVEPHLPDVLARIEGALKPWVAAIHGTALGGGLELALACGYRVATPEARLGLPEVTLGVIPGAGGTVRLPRLIAPEKALTMIAGGKPVVAGEALAMGLIDAVAKGDLVEAALPLAANPPRRLLDRQPRLDSKDAFDAAAQKLLAKTRGQTAPQEAVEAVRDAYRLPADQALAAERQRFLTLRDGPQSAALRHIFFAERATAKLPRLKDVAPRPITRVGVVGGGTMGAGIAAACLLAGFPVTMVERDPEAGRARVETILAGSRARGLISDARHGALLSSFQAVAEYDALAASDLVIEAVFEEMAVKQEVFAQLDQVVTGQAVLATNTSYLDVRAIAQATQRPERVIGLHFFSPAHIMKLLEIVAPEGLADDVLATGVALAKRLGKIPVVAGVCDGFIANRIMSAYRREAEYMLEDGALPWEIDAAMTGFGFPMGIFQMQDLAGLDIAWAMRKRRAATRDPAERYVEIGDRLCEQGRLGRKTGRGYYLYESGRGAPDPEVAALIRAEAARKGIERQEMSAEAIMARILGGISETAEAILDEGIARSPGDIDVVMVNAFGFPRWTGGPLFMRGQTG